MTMFERNLETLRATLQGSRVRHVVGVFNREGYVVKALDLSPARRVVEIERAMCELEHFLSATTARDALVVVSITSVDPSVSPSEATANPFEPIESRLKSVAGRVGVEFSVERAHSCGASSPSPVMRARAMAGGARY